MPQDYTLLLVKPTPGGAAPGDPLSDDAVSAALVAAAGSAELDLGNSVRAMLLSVRAGFRAIRLETAPERSRWGPFWLEAELGFPEFRLVQQLAPTYDVTVLAYSEKLRMGWMVRTDGGTLSMEDLQNEPLPAEVKAMVDVLAGSAVVREICPASEP